ncbi:MULTISPECIES: GNAT family N-acetyltransferase [Streptomyces]|uniref:GNAT family N-acetyltransferase n=1 Tax=Streptomyces TaxID=1883 RepID=UPI0013002737|nr:MULTISPECIES: GNAT family N-acetyltransferase [Streptomyces]
MAEVFLRRLSRWQAEDRRNDFATLHAESQRGSGEPPDPSEFLTRFSDHLQQPGFDLVIASDPGLVGCAYGFRIEREGGWFDRFSGVPHELVELAEVTGARQLFVVAELMVRPERRRHGVGGRLLDQLLTRIGVPVAVVLLAPEERQAKDAFSSWGWSKAGDMTPRGDAKPLEAWCLRRDG